MKGDIVIEQTSTDGNKQKRCKFLISIGLHEEC